MAKAPKLRDLQLILLSTASQREGGNLLPLPEAAARDIARARKDIASLLKRGLAAEAPTTHLDQVWREEDDHRLTVILTEQGRSAIGVASNPGPTTANAAAAAETLPAAPSEKADARPGSKKAMLLEMLRREGGASLDELVQATGWLPHTTRAAITGVRKNHTVIKTKVEGGTRYSIEAAE